MKRFTQQFADSIVCILEYFDRVICKSYLPFGNDRHLNDVVDRVLNMRRKDFLPFVKQQSSTLVAHAKEMAALTNAPYHYFQGKIRKDKFIDKFIREHGLSEGLVTVLCCQETWRTIKLFQGQNRPYLAFARRPQRVL